MAWKLRGSKCETLKYSFDRLLMEAYLFHIDKILD